MSPTFVKQLSQHPSPVDTRGPATCIGRLRVGHVDGRREVLHVRPSNQPPAVRRLYLYGQRVLSITTPANTSPRRDCIENKPPLTGEYETRYRLFPAAGIPCVPAHTSVRRRQSVCTGLPSARTVPRLAFTHGGLHGTLGLISLAAEANTDVNVLFRLRVSAFVRSFTGGGRHRLDVLFTQRVSRSRRRRL